MEEPGAHGDIAENVNAVIARIAKGGLTAEQQSFALLKQGRLYAEQESYDSAIEVFNKAISLHVSVHNFIARAACYEKILSWEDAYFDYCFALRLDPESGLLLAHRGLCLAKLNKFDIALEDLTKACQTEPSNANFYNRASVSVDAKRYQAALRDVIHILKNEDQPPPPALRSRCMYLKAVIGLELGYYDTVIEDMRELLLANPNIGPTRALLAKAFRLKGDPATAETQISFAIAVDPSSPDHYIERSNARASIGTSQSISDAVTDLDAAVRMLMRPIGVKSQAVSRLSRQSSDLMPVLQTMSSREFEVVKPPLSRQLGSTGKMEQRRVLLVTAPSTAPESPSRNKPAASCPPSALRDAMSTNLSPKSILRSRATSMDSLDSNSDCNSHADIDRSRRPRLVRTASVSKKDAIAEIVGERSLAKRMKVVAHVLCQRAETRLLLLSEGMPLNVRRMHMQRSLHDAIKAIELAPSADDLKVTLASCLVHLEEYGKAQSVLADVLSRHPKSVRALFRLALCQRGEKNYRKAIVTLNMIIDMTALTATGEVTFNRSESAEVLSSNELRGQRELGEFALSQDVDDCELDSFGGVALARVFELRGALFLELQSHALAATDLGKAILLEPDSPHCYLLRGICHREMGRFELALYDLAMCEEKDFGDICTLQTARASVYRLLANWEAAKTCLQVAISKVPHVLDQTRLAYLKAQLTVVWIELEQFKRGADEATAAMSLITVPASRYANEKIGVLKKASRRVSDVIKFAKLDSKEVISLKLEWILRYHCGLAHYNLGAHEHFIEAVAPCVTTLADFAPDSISLGIVHFFLGIALSILKQFKEALNNFNAALNSAWSTVHDSNQVLCLFARGKIFQILGDRDASISNFNEALLLDPNNAFILFRRAWLYKSAFSDHTSAGADFETARRLMPRDPNFTVDYKHILHIQYVSIESDPDLKADFPALSNLHKLGSFKGSIFQESGDDYL